MSADVPAKSAVDADGHLAVAQARADLALDAARLGEYEWDVVRDVIVVSARMAAITGVPEGEHPAEHGEIVFGPILEEDRARVREHLLESLRQGLRFSLEFRFIRPDDGRSLWVETAGEAVRVPGGGPWKLIGVLRDVTERKQAEQAREALVAELDHRVKNVLVSVQSLAAQTARRTTSLESFLKTLDGRLQAMIAAHTLLSRTRWRGAELADVVAAELGPLAHGRARWSGPPLMLSPRATNAVALALHELATNAMRFGALSTEVGRVDVRWTAQPAAGFELTWSERRGPPVTPPERLGFGAMVLERLAGGELGGSAEIEFRPAGVHVVLRADASAVAVPSGLQLDDDGRDGGGRRAAASSGNQSADIRGLKILIVEDAALLAIELEAALIEAGAEVVGLASSPEEALGLMDRTFDVALLDADLGGRSAAPVAEALVRRDTPFLLTIGQHDMTAYLESPAVTVRKPYNMRQMAVALARATGRLGSL